MAQRGRPRSPEVAARAAEVQAMRAEGKSITEISNALNIPRSTVYDLSDRPIGADEVDGARPATRRTRRNRTATRRTAPTRTATTTAEPAPDGRAALTQMAQAEPTNPILAMLGSALMAADTVEYLRVRREDPARERV